MEKKILETLEEYGMNPMLQPNCAEKILALLDVSGSASDFYTDLMKLINAHCKKGLSKPDLVAKMEYATDSCKMS